MIQLIFIFYIAIAALGMFIHSYYERRPSSSARYIDFEQFYLNILMPLVMGSTAFVLIIDQIKFPAVPFFISDVLLFYGLALFACICFLGCGMHISTKLSSRFINKSHQAYKVNKFYHIYAGHILAYLGIALFMMTLSLLSIKHPDPSSEASLVYVVSGGLFGIFALSVTKRPNEIIKFLWPILFFFIIVYLRLIYPYRSFIQFSPLALFITALMLTIMAIITKEAIFTFYRKASTRINLVSRQ